MKIKDGYLPLEKVSVIDINSDINETKSYVNNANYTRFPVIKHCWLHSFKRFIK